MRFSTSFVVLAAAIGAQAAPQDVQPISQISDGQIQAPPATAAPVSSDYAVPSVSAGTEVLPSVTPVPLPSVVPSASVIPSGYPSVVVPVPLPSVVPSASVIPSGYPTVVVPAPSASANATAPAASSGVSYPNSTVSLSTGGSTSGPASAPSATQSPPVNNGATANMVSFAALAAAAFAFFA